MAEIPCEVDEPLMNTACERCSEEFTHDKSARLLHCLHTFCDACLEAHSKQPPAEQKEQNGAAQNGSPENEGSSSDDGKLHCPECKTVYTTDQITANPFVNIVKKTEPRTEDGSPSEGKFPVCTSCDDNQKASSFCVDCEESLCDPCVIAHKRVKLTKDHTISNQVKPDQAKDGSANEARQKQMYCKTHKMEMLKLFCLTCEALTCRDCQLNEHKDHKYQFIEQTVDQQRDVLKDGVEALKKRLSSNKELSERMSEKEKDIKKQQVETFNEVRHMADTITNELISWCKQLLNFLQGVCHGRMRDLTYKKKEVDSFAKKASHTIKFVEEALASGDDLSVLFAKSVMSKNLKALQEQNINVQSSMFELSIKYENDAKFITKNVSKMGFINVNGKSYPQQGPAKDKTPPPAASAPAPLQNLTPDNFCKNISEFLNKFPQNIKQQYMGLSEDKRKVFLQRLMQREMTARQQQQQQQQQQQLSPGHTAVAASQAPRNQFNTDSGAIQDLYGTVLNHPGMQQQQVRPRGTYFPETTIRGNSFVPLRQQLANQQPNQQPKFGQVPNFQQWRGGQPAYGSGGYNSGNSSLQNLAQLSNRDHTLGVSGFNTFSDLGPHANMAHIPNVQANQKVASADSSREFIPRDKLPPGRIDIDPLNLRTQASSMPRVKQEPRDRDVERSACKFSSSSSVSVPKSPTAVSTISYHSSPSFPPTTPDFSASLQSPPPTAHLASPSLTPSPCHSDGAPAKSSSPPDTDISQVMDHDRNELLKGLTHPHPPSATTTPTTPIPGGLTSPTKGPNTYHLQPNHDPGDPSEDYCRVCHNGGDLLCCDRCPRVFHLQCHIPAVSTNLSSSEVWTCTFCSAGEADLVIGQPIPREFEINSNGKRKAPNGLVDKEIRTCERILLDLFCLEASTIFHEPVPKSVPNYHKVVQRPMDFATIKLKLRRGHFAHYNTVEEFLSDVKLVFRNCYKFNPETTEVHQVGKSVEKYFEALVRRYLPSYLPHLSRRSPSPAPVLLDTNGGGEPQAKKRRSPAPNTGPLDLLDNPVHIL